MAAASSHPGDHAEAGTAAVPRAVRWLPAVFRPTFEELLPRTRRERTRRDWVIDLLFIGLTIAFGVAAHHAEMTDGGPMPRWQRDLDLALIPFAAIALLWRRRWPLRVTVFVGLIALIAPSAGFATIVAAFAVGAYSAPTVALGGISLLVIGAPISAWIVRDAGNPWWSDALFGVIITIGIGAWGMFTGTRRQLLVTLQERARRAEDEQAMHVEQARQQERTRIAREMHDVLAHRMSLLSVHAGALEFRPDAPAEDVARAAGVIRQTAHEALEELRTVIGVLRVDELTGDGAGAGGAQPEPPQPTLAAVPRLVGDWQQAGARVDLELRIDADAVPAAVGRTAYRVVQEGLTNASKHAPAARVHVVLEGRPGDELIVEVSNPLAVGTPASGIPGTGIGLIGLRERTELAGGRFLASADLEARAFVLRVALPWGAAS